RLPLPPVIQKIALITSIGSDAYNDFMHCLTSNEYGYRFKIDEYNVLVQGHGAQPALIAALSRIKATGGYDAVVITRGGGAPADFLPFDDYTLALQVATFPLPIITGIGHHMNQGICDFFARVHTKTPSIAAQFIIDQNHSFEKRILQLSAAIRVFSSQIIVGQEKRLEALQRDLKADVKGLMVHSNNQIGNLQGSLTARVSGFLNRYQQQLTMRTSSLAFIPQQLVRIEKQRLTSISQSMVSRAPQLLATKSRELMLFKQNINNISPQRILERGFAIIKKDGHILSSASNIQAGDHLEIIHDGSVLQTEVESKKNYDGREFNL
ncbi:MAG TPA: exodeoxyribonuclease VII large subunit, partial [Chitinophagaceae bacterium]